MMESPAAPWPADQIERRPVMQLIPYARNARKHGPAQITMIADLIREYGWTMPVLVDEDGEIIVGHGRVLAAQQLGLPEIPTITAHGWTDKQKRAYRVADNQSAALSTWDKTLLRVELTDLATQGADLEALGFAASDAASDAETTQQLPQALQLEPAREYALIVCADPDEWERLKVALSLTPVRRGGYRKGSQFDDVGTQRVVPASHILDLIDAGRGAVKGTRR
jgi:ParB-like chromosome segregation protein Spo0J